MGPQKEGTRLMRAATEMNLLQEDNGREDGNSQDKHEPLKIVALEPAGEVQNQNDDCDDVKGVKHVFFSPERTLLRPRPLLARMIIHEFNQ
ncbi:MAG: hypothetical protein ABIS45_13730 [Burkholderiales bacterium]